MKHQTIKNKLFDLGYSFEEVGPGILVIPNFFTDNDLEPLWSIINNSTQDDWEKDYWDSQVLLSEKKYGRRDLKNLIKEGLVEYTNHWHDKAIGIDSNISNNLSKNLSEIFSFDDDIVPGGFVTIQRQYENSPLIAHVDNHADPTIIYAVIGYINDDYTDGDLVFPKLGVRIKPPAKSIVIFPSGEDYLHGVESPGVGPVRYVLPSFVYSSSISPRTL
jgi:hypothetical protein